MVKQGVLREVLVGIPGLVDLAIRSTPRRKAIAENRSIYPVELGQVIKAGYKWPDLQFLTLGGIHTTRERLREVLAVHCETLRRLDLGFVGLDAH